MPSRRQQAAETVFPLTTTIPQHFPVSYPIVYLRANTQAELDAGVQNVKNDLARLANGPWHDEGWVRAHTGDIGWMIQCPTFQSNDPAPRQVVVVPTQEEQHEAMVQGREARAKALEGKRTEYEAREAAKSKPVRERKSRPEGYVDKRTPQRQIAAERAAKKREYRANNPIPTTRAPSKDTGLKTPTEALRVNIL
ncbi:MAG: hypothetical protein Q9166_006859 [cf. Caloplaca sp. 2 TL-2023]